ncbi:hypothetical protein GARC_3134 [Paraglaciecola arctica BSs20135]|uniref:Uncharacterized protein n=1 Tax=Paraglaciecola arctica BSs20135 TaxID=493475 RepID=K6YTP9_9ALTE|nr:hypothetical protein GARC_3134 [Paraglaciecola arctica BSs20135]
MIMIWHPKHNRLFSDISFYLIPLTGYKAIIKPITFSE